MTIEEPFSIARDAAIATNLWRDGSMLRPLTGGAANHVFLLDERYTIRLGTGPDGPCFPKSAEILRAVESRMRAPKVIYTDFSRKAFPCNIMIVTHLPGPTLHACWDDLTKMDRLRILGVLPAELAVLHALPIDPRFELPSLDPVQKLKTDLACLLEPATCSLPAGMRRVMREFWETHLGVLATAPRPVLIHNDIHWNNIIVHDGKYAGVIDFDDAQLDWRETEAFALVHLLVAAEHPTDSTPLKHPDSMRRACRAVRSLWPGVLSTPGTLERYILQQIPAIITDYASPPPWLSAEESRTEALDTFHGLFESNPHQWFDA